MTGHDAGEGEGTDPPSGSSVDGMDGLEGRVVDVLSRLLSTEARARIYVYLREHPGRTSEEIGRGTDLYPSTVRETLAAMHEEGLVSRGKRENDGAGNNPYEYTAIPPGVLVRDLVEGLQEDLNTLCNLDDLLAGQSPVETDPVRIEVRAGEGEGGD